MPPARRGCAGKCWSDRSLLTPAPEDQRLLRLDPGLLDHLGPQCRLVGKESGGGGGRRRSGLERDPAEHLADLLALENLDDVAVDLVRQGGRRARRRDQSEPGDRFETGQARFGEGRHVRYGGGTLEIGDAQELDLILAVERDR